MRTRVLINAIHAKSGGGIVYLRNVLPLLAEDAELDLHVLIHPDQRKLLEPLPPGIKVIERRFRNGFFSLLAWEQVAVPLLARRIGAKVTFSPANFGPLFAPKPVILLRNALAVAEEERRLAKRLYWAALSAMTSLSLATSRAAIAVSAYAADAMTTRFGRAERVSVIHHGVSTAFSPPKGDARRETFLLAVSDIYIQKNLHGLIEALALVRQTHPAIRLKIAGRPVDADYAQRLRDLMSKTGLGSSVEFLGSVRPDALAELYRRCLGFVFPSTVETFGNPLVEAMASGCAIASSNAAAMPEILGDAAVFFDPHDTDAMAKAIRRLFDEPALREELSAKALQRAAAFSWVKTAAATAAVLKAAAS